MKKNAASFSIAPLSNEKNMNSANTNDHSTQETWKEIKSEFVKKRSKVFFFVDRIIKLYDNGTLGYFK